MSDPTKPGLPVESAEGQAVKPDLAFVRLRGGLGFIRLGEPPAHPPLGPLPTPTQVSHMTVWLACETAVRIMQAFAEHGPTPYGYTRASLIATAGQMAVEVAPYRVGAFDAYLWPDAFDMLRQAREAAGVTAPASAPRPPR